MQTFEPVSDILFEPLQAVSIERVDDYVSLSESDPEDDILDDEMDDEDIEFDDEDEDDACEHGKGSDEHCDICDGEGDDEDDDDDLDDLDDLDEIDGDSIEIRP